MMKKKIIFIFILITLVTSFSYSLGKFVNISANIFLPSDSNFKEAYSSSVLMPSLKIGIIAHKNIYAWIGYQFFSKKGETIQLKEEIKYTQYNTGIGLGYLRKINNKINMDLYTGLYYIAYKEVEINVDNPSKVRDSTIGFIFGVSMYYRLNKLLFLSSGVRYLLAKDTIDTEQSNFGGIQLNMGFGLRF